MRKIGEFDQEKLALRFWGYLKQHSIDASLEEEEAKCWSVWVGDEDTIEFAQEEFEKFQKNPEKSEFNPTTIDKKISPSKTEKGGKNRYKEFKLKEKWQMSERSLGVVTLSLIITSIGVFLLSGMGKNSEIVGKFYISEIMDGRLSEFLGGEIWRVVTPIFLHGSKDAEWYFNFIHIGFNMILLKDFGSQIEAKKGAKFFLTFALLLAVCSTLLQFWMSGPNFGGMSGVVYGLFGYVWIKNRLDPGDGFQIDSSLAFCLFACFVFGFTGTLSIANWAHTGGLVLGLAWGYGSAYRWNRGKM